MIIEVSRIIGIETNPRKLKEKEAQGKGLVIVIAIAIGIKRRKMISSATTQLMNCNVFQSIRPHLSCSLSISFPQARFPRSINSVLYWSLIIFHSFIHGTWLAASVPSFAITRRPQFLYRPRFLHSLPRLLQSPPQFQRSSLLLYFQQHFPRINWHKKIILVQYSLAITWDAI